MSDETTYHVWTASREKGSNLLFLLYLAQQADDWGYCFPSVMRIAERLHMSERAIQLIKRKLLAGSSGLRPELRVVASSGPHSPDILQVLSGLSDTALRSGEAQSPIAQAIQAGKPFQEIYAAGKTSRGAKIAPQRSRSAKIAPHLGRGEIIAPLHKPLGNRGKTNRGAEIAPNINSVVVKNKQQGSSVAQLTKREEIELHTILEGVGFQGKIPDFILAAMKSNKRLIRSWYYNVIRLEGNNRQYMGGRFRTGVESGRMAPGWKDPVAYQNKQVMRCDVPVGEKP